MTGALTAGGILVFVMIVAAATFNVWPRIGNPLAPDGSTVQPAAETTQSTAGGRVTPATASSVKGGAAPSPRAHGGGPGRNDAANDQAGSVGGPDPPQSPVGGGSSTAPGGGSPSSGGTGNGIADTVKNVGNTVQGTTGNVGNTVNQALPGTNAGNVISGAGTTVNQTIQGLTGGSR